MIEPDSFWWPGALDFFVRLVFFVVLVLPIMITAGHISWQRGIVGNSGWWFYGGLLGGLTLWFGCGVLVLGWPVLRFYGLLP